MKLGMMGLGLLATTGLTLAGQARENLKVFISADMEGVTGVVNREEVDPESKDYDLFRKLMTEEVNAAVEGAQAAGATEVVVRDAHWSARNLLPDLLHPEAKLLRDWADSPHCMMEGIDSTFAAVVFIGYHGRAGMARSTLSHTISSRKFFGVALDGIEIPEAGLNAAIAGVYGVPVALVAGDTGVCEQVRELLGPIETVAVKEATGFAAKSIHPTKARKLIKEGTTRALRRLKDLKPYRPAPPHNLRITFIRPGDAYSASWIPGAKREGERVVSFSSADLMDVMRGLWLSSAVSAE